MRFFSWAAVLCLAGVSALAVEGPLQRKIPPLGATEFGAKELVREIARLSRVSVVLGNDFPTETMVTSPERPEASAAEWFDRVAEMTHTQWTLRDVQGTPLVVFGPRRVPEPDEETMPE